MLIYNKDKIEIMENKIGIRLTTNKFIMYLFADYTIVSNNDALVTEIMKLDRNMQLSYFANIKEQFLDVEKINLKIEKLLKVSNFR